MNEERGRQILEQMLGSETDAVRQTWRELHPDFEKYILGFVAGEIWTRPGLELKQRSLVSIAAIAALGRPQALGLNVRMALNNGATPLEITETILQIAPYAGFPAVWDALVIVRDVLRKTKGTA